jgi:cytochrome c5
VADAGQEAGADAGVEAGADAAVPPPVLDGAALYLAHCDGCHANGKKGRPVAATQAAIAANIGGMGGLAVLTPEELAAIAAAP